MIIQLTIGSILFIFPIKEVEANGTTYYVDATTGDDGDSGLTEALAWQTIAKVNASSFNPGDSILFKRGETWREQLTVPSSGSAGSPITFGAYGTGDAPIINGADLVTTWTATAIPIATGSDGFEVGDADLTNGDGSFWTSGFKSEDGATLVGNDTSVVDYGTYSAKLVHTAAGTKYAKAYYTFTQAGDNYVRFRMRVEAMTANATDTLQLAVFGYGGAIRAIVNIKYATANTYTLNGFFYTDGGTGGITGTTVLNTGTWYTIQARYLNHATTGGMQYWINGVSEGSDYTKDTDYTNSNPTAVYVGSNFESATFTAATVYFDNLYYHTSYIDTALANVWEATCTTEPKVVIFDGTFGDKKTSVTALVNEFDWYWASNVLYVYSATDPDSAYTAPGIEAGQRDRGIVATDKDYIVVDGLNTKYANTAGIQNSRGDNWITRNCTVSDSYVYGILYLGSTTEDLPVVGGEIYSNTLNSSSLGNSSLLMAQGTTDVTIRNNTITALSSGGTIGTSSGNDTGAGATSSGTQIYLNDISGASAGIIVKYTTGAYVYRNHVHDGSGCGIAINRYSTGAYVYYNLIHDLVAGSTTWNGLDINIGSTGGFAYNNTIYKVAGYSITLEATTAVSDDWTVKNNILDSSLNADVSGHNASIYIQSGVSGYAFDTNIYNIDEAIANVADIGIISDLATWNAVAGVGTDLSEDPKMTDPASGDFTLQSTSPCINAGTDVGLTEDYAGNTVSRCSIVDIGAYENQTGACPVTTTGGGSPGGYSNPPIPGANGFRCIINNNDAKTTSREVTLTLEAGSNVKYVAVSEKQDLSGAGFEAFEPEIFTKPFTLSLGDGLKRVYAQFLTAYNRFSDIVYDEIVLDTSSSAKQEEQPKPPEQAEVPKSPETTVIVDGDLIRAINSFDVYIVKILEGKKFRRLILNPDIFNQYKHLKWENVKEVGQIILDQYITSDLVRALGDTKVYKLYANGDIGEKRWIKTFEDFLSFAYDWGAVYMINNYERNSYSTGLDLISHQ